MAQIFHGLGSREDLLSNDMLQQLRALQDLWRALEKILPGLVRVNLRQYKLKTVDDITETSSETEERFACNSRIASQIDLMEQVHLSRDSLTIHEQVHLP